MRLVLVGTDMPVRAQLQPTRQFDYLSPEEKARLQEIKIRLFALVAQKKLSVSQAITLYLYNSRLNGEWKRQNFYKGV